MASSYPATVPQSWHAPRGWLPAALCIHSHEGAWNANTGNGYYGGFQFLLSTWRSVGGLQRPDLASTREQVYRAYLVWRRDGGSWHRSLLLEERCKACGCIFARVPSKNLDPQRCGFCIAQVEEKEAA